MRPCPVQCRLGAIADTSQITAERAPDPWVRLWPEFFLGQVRRLGIQRDGRSRPYDGVHVARVGMRDKVGPQ
jgi:hypothetical protein